ncbi:flagellar motor protein MotB [uncultured Acetatifactor sp.]|jgi:chemotaxis protein MotB|uniref:OmpA/MotB family protein n=1 Tax=uncultured Acetatifactor sp. TaxID=1671927 RepID=UPI0025F33730|nr:flagellar motor protein MotB [uncultured Acetatifactor sp.]MCI9230032.1 flagellar motor protein MotB [Lachnospiraceae bacterium]MCI9574797.1 flagellar motor protein MotB [Lachnospiraceae bacterium]
MAKRKEDTPPAGSPAWMATFSDLMNLLLCFFVMLFAMSSIEEAKLQEFVAAMNNTFSVFDGGASAIGDGFLISNGVSQLNELDQYINSTGKTADSDTDGEDFQDYEMSPEAMEEILQDKMLEENEERVEEIEEVLTESDIADEVEVSFTAQYVKLTMNGGLLFDSGSAQLKDDAKLIIDKVGLILERYGNAGTIEIEGHTDNVPMKSAQYPSNEELSSARALSVFYYLMDSTTLNPLNLKHAGMGERVPIADNSTPEGRSRNRRVEILIYNPSQG